MLSFLVVNKPISSLRWFAALLMSVAIWTIAYGIELGCTELEDMLFWIKVEYLGICMLPLLWVFFVLLYLERYNWLGAFTYSALAIYAATTYILVLTNDYHQLFYASTEVETSGDFPLLAIEAGPWYYLHTIIFYAMVFLGLILLIRNFKSATESLKPRITSFY